MIGAWIILAAALIATGGAIIALSLQRRVPWGLGVAGGVIGGGCVWLGIAVILTSV